MVLWLIFAVMTAVVAIALLRPLNRKHDEAQGRSSYEAAIYHEQLKTLQDEIDSGELSASEAQSARAEIGRRLLKASSEDGDSQPRSVGNAARRAVSVLVIVAVPIISLGLYAVLGSPNLPGLPAAERLAAAGENQTIEQLVARVEQHLRANPDDARGWEVLGPAMMRLGRFDAAAAAFRRIMELQEPTAKHMSLLGEALMFGNGGMITAEARQVFADAAEMDASLPDPQFYLGLARLQDRDNEGAVAIWRKLLDNSPADAPWRGEIETQIAQALGIPRSDAPGPDAAEVAAASQMSAEERQAMIAEMVARLNERLSENGGTAEEWLRLANAYRVMGEAEKRDDVIARARKALGEDPGALDLFEAGIAKNDNG